MSTENKVTILLVEDDEGQAKLIGKNLTRNVACNVVMFSAGRTMLKYVEEREPCELSRHVVVLDLNLPGLDGFEVVRRIKASEKSAHLPVFILSSTDSPQEIERCYRQGASLYLAKSVDYRAFQETLQFLAAAVRQMQLP